MSEDQRDEQRAYQAFRQRLDAILRRKDPNALHAFLVTQGQWEQDANPDVERAMWLMIATSPGLADLREEARDWLIGHGYTAEVSAIFGGGKPQKPGGSPSRSNAQPPGHQSRKMRTGAQQTSRSGTSAQERQQP
jgi:hypothetical protein